MSDLKIIGAGGFGREVASVAKILGKWNEIYFIDDKYIPNTSINGIKVIGNLNVIKSLSGHVFIGLGSLEARINISKKIVKYNTIEFPNIIHPNNSWINNEFVDLGDGNYIGDGVVGTTNISIGNFNLINLGCLLSHDTKIRSYVNLMHGVKITSGVLIQDKVFVGAGATIVSNIQLKSGTKIEANQLIY